MTEATTSSQRGRALLALLIGVAAIVGAGRTASAHTDFSSSTPTDGAVVDGPLTEIVVEFTNPAEPAGDGFQLLDPTGAIIAPTTIDPTDGTSFVLEFDPPLTAGTYGVRWSVRAGDAHPVEGSFRFEVTGPARTTEPTSTEPTGTEPTAGGTASAPSTTTPVVEHMSDMDMADHSAMSDDTLEAFLDIDAAATDSAKVGRAGRAVTMLGLIFGVGVLAALVWTIRGRREELIAHLDRIRLAGLVVLTGGFIEYASLAEADPSFSFGSLTSTKVGLAILLKLVGGAAVLAGFHRRSGTITPPTHALSAAVVVELEHDDGHRWAPTPSTVLGLAGYAAAVISFWFDGHTVSKGPWAVHALADLVHLGAAAVWAGGVFAITITAWARRHRAEPTGLAAMVVRFSTIATISLVAVVAAGTVMAWMILDTPGDLVDTPWGRLLIAKTSLVAVVAAIGGYNHFRLRPALEQRPDDPSLARDLRVSLSIESAVFVAIIVVTAFLVAAAI